MTLFFIFYFLYYMSVRDKVGFGGNRCSCDGRECHFFDIVMWGHDQPAQLLHQRSEERTQSLWLQVLAEHFQDVAAGPLDGVRGVIQGSKYRW